MKEFAYPLVDDLKVGLRPNDNHKAKGLTDLRNAKINKDGLVPFVELTNSITGQSVSWPYPQLFIGTNYRLLCTQTSVYSIDSNWTLTEELSGLSAGSTLWDFTDYGDYFVLANGSVIVYINHGTVDTPVSPAVYASMTSNSTFPRCATYCNFNGQLIGGNVKSTWHDCGISSVCWSNIGNVVFTPKPNQAGYRPNMPYDGEVMRVKELKSAAIVYCENGIMAMIPHQEMWRWEHIKDIGVPYKGAISGDKDSHIFVDKQGVLWTLGKDLTLTELGYSEFMNELTLTSTVISHDNGKDEYYISDGVKGFILTKFGLSRVHQLVTSCCSVDGTSVGFFKTDNNKEFRLATNNLDFGIRALKTLAVLEVGISNLDTVYSALDWKSDNNADLYNTSPWIPLNPTGVSYPGITASDFIVKLRSDSYEEIDLEYVVTRVKLSDKRAHRGYDMSWSGHSRAPMQR